MENINFNTLFYIVLFLLSFSVFYIGSSIYWFVINVLVHFLWLSIVSNALLLNKLVLFKSSIIFISFNIFTILLIVVIFVIDFFSLSFVFRINFATYYWPLMYFTAGILSVSFIVNYTIILRYLYVNKPSNIRFFFFFLTTLFYPLGHYTIAYLRNKNSLEKTFDELGRN